MPVSLVFNSALFDDMQCNEIQDVFYINVLIWISDTICHSWV